MAGFLFLFCLQAFAQAAQPVSADIHPQAQDIVEAHDMGQLYFHFAPGMTDLDISAEASTDSVSDDTTQLLIQFSLGYQFNHRFGIEFSRFDHIDFFSWILDDDHYQLTETTLGVVYRHPAGPFQLVPKLGLSHYAFKAREGHFLELPEIKKQLKDEDLFLSMGVEYMFNPHLGLLLEWTWMDAEFGKVTSNKLGIRFVF